MPKIYCGTYAKYNSGSIAGKWIDLEDFAGDKEGFYKACAELHADESDPEFMFQDYEGFPSVFYSESGLPDALFDWLELDEDDRTMVEMYAEAFKYSADDVTIDQAQEAFFGKYDSEADAAQEIIEEMGGVKIPDEVVVDWKATWECNLQHGFSTTFSDGQLWVFNN